MTKQLRASNSMEMVDFSVQPIEKLKSLAEHWKLQLDNDAFACKLDQEDPLRIYRSKFVIAKKKGSAERWVIDLRTRWQPDHNQTYL